jgi:ABC-2 type transport system ATP-binding protein
MTAEVIAARGLRVSYGKVEALRGVDLSIAQGEIFGLIGPDGAGKTTALDVLAGILEPSGGAATVLGKSPRDARDDVGFLPQRFALFADLSVDENLAYVAGLRGVPRAEYEERRERYLRLMGIERFGGRLARQLSGGMKQKLSLCAALVAAPRILLLDEPTTGVDPLSRRDFWRVIKNLAQESLTIAIATPDLEEAERCDRVALLYDGEVRRLGTPAELSAALGLDRLEIRTRSIVAAERAVAALGDGRGIEDVQSFGDRLDVLVRRGSEFDSVLGDELARAGVAVASIERAGPTLENVFVETLRELRPEPPFVAFPRSRPPRPVGGVAIEARGLVKDFGPFRAVDRLDLTVSYGEMYGLLGANGAGKTTTIKMLCGLLPRTEGTVMLGGQEHDLRSPALRRRIGYMSQKFTLYEDLTVRENLDFYAGVYDVPRAERARKIAWVLESSGLEGHGDTVVGSLPGGWRQRVAFGASVMHEPELLFLDEPTSGVDPLARRQFWRLIEAFARDGTAVLVTTHYMDEAQHCGRIALMAEAHKVAEGTPSEVVASVPGARSLDDAFVAIVERAGSRAA